VRVRGLDVGTGASAIYALLGAAAHGWSFVATDVTDEALYWARRNVDANPQLRPLIQVRDARIAPAAGAAAEAHPDGGTAWPVLAGVLRAGEAFDFTCCNPPFFGSIAEAGTNPATACGGTAAEMVCPGGEAAFIARHVAESQLPGVRGAVTWFTTLCGKKATLRAMTEALRLARAPAVRTTCLQQGKTTRWALAWSWLPQAAATQTRPLPMEQLAAASSPDVQPGLPPPRPCARVSFQLRVGARDAGAPAAVLSALHAACCEHSRREHCTCDAAAFTVTGQLDCAASGDGAGQAAKRRKRDVPDAADADKAEPHALFFAGVQRASPASVTVTVQLVGAGRDRPAAQQALAVLARAVQAVLHKERMSAGV
jgi:23S rRNA A1618 N6-methylase RlmF